MAYLIDRFINFNIPESIDARSLLPESLIEDRELNKIPILIM